MLGLSKLLVVDDSRVFRKMMKTIFLPHWEQILLASTCQEGKKKVAENRDLSVTLVDVFMPDGDGFQLLEYISELDDPKPLVILLTARPVDEDAERAADLGAIGYLAKPISYRDIAWTLTQHQGTTSVAARRVRCRSLGKAFLVDPRGKERLHLAWDIRDLSIGGAFLETNGPVPVGTNLELELQLGRETVRVQVEVIRLQEPSWAQVGGVWVLFHGLDGSTRRVLDAYIFNAD